MTAKEKKYKITHAVVSAIYFADSSDYRNFLWEILEINEPKMYKLLGENDSKAFDKSAKRLGIK